LEPTKDDGDFFTGVLAFLAAKAGNVFFFIGMAAFSEPTEDVTNDVMPNVLW